MGSPLTVHVCERIQATPSARILRLGLDGASFPYRPGQGIRAGLHGQARREPYSIASAPEETRRDGSLELLVSVDRTTSGPHLGDAREGALVDIEGPFGSFLFPDHPAERAVLFIAGGTGIAPLRAMLQHALRQPKITHIGLLYSARTPREFAYEAELRRLAREGRLELRQTVTRGANASWTGDRGRIDRVRLETMVRDPATLCFLCGPPALTHEVPRLLAAIGISEERIRKEDWG